MADPTEVFLRGVWRIINSIDDPAVVERLASLRATDEPLGDYGAVVRRMLNAGVSTGDIIRFAQIVSYETAFSMLYHLDDPIASYEGFPDVGDEQLAWTLFLVDPDNEELPISPLNMLFESLLTMDPSGREMRPEI